MKKIQYTVTEKLFPLVIDFENLGFIEIYKNGTMYTNIKFNGNIKTIKKIIKISNKERFKGIIRNIFTK